MTEHRFAVNVTPRDGILDPQGRAVEQSLPHLGVRDVFGVRVGRRVELTVRSDSPAAARATVEQLARELLSNPLIEQFAIEELGATSSAATLVAPGGHGEGAPPA
jgi:phosphoribosylformylglycinamidine synthase PurS subunit